MVRTVMRDARLGKAIEVDQVAPVVQNLTESILRNPGALLGLLRIKTKDDYTFLHSVSVCTLLVAFCHSRGMDAHTVREAGVGALLHDTGKALVPDAILEQARRDRPEFALIDATLAEDLRVFPGELYYWRAWNDMQVSRLDAAWTEDAPERPRE